MSKLFYDHLIELEEVEKKIKALAKNSEEREELWQLVDEIIHHRVLGCIFDRLPEEHHYEFLVAFHKSPHDEKLILFVNEQIEGDIELTILKEMERLKEEILNEIFTET